MTATKTAWTHKVAKTQRGGDGKWFRYPAAATFATADEAKIYAEKFASEQAGVVGTRIIVLARKGDACVAEYTPAGPK